MAATMVVQIPEVIQERMEGLNRENFCLWMFIASQDLWDEAKHFIDDNMKMGKSFDGWQGSGLAYADICRNYSEPF